MCDGSGRSVTFAVVDAPQIQLPNQMKSKSSRIADLSALPPEQVEQAVPKQCRPPNSAGPVRAPREIYQIPQQVRRLPFSVTVGVVLVLLVAVMNTVGGSNVGRAICTGCVVGDPLYFKLLVPLSTVFS